MATLPPHSKTPEENRPATSVFLVFSWLFVGLPLAWGVVQTLIKSLSLFH